VGGRRKGGGPGASGTHRAISPYRLRAIRTFIIS
jgi:hypothetical protein